LISGSEDRSAYIYDIGSTKVIDKTKNKDHGDAVTDIAVNPQVYEWATASIDGHARCFRYPALKASKNRQSNGGGGGGLAEKPCAIKFGEA
jgi:WD40 repeat protein